MRLNDKVRRTKCELRKVWVLSVLALVSGCNPNAEKVPYFGKWNGGFEVTELQSGGSEALKKRNSLNGYLMLYATHQSFKLHMEGEQEIIDLDGTWELEGDKASGKRRAILKVTKIKIDDMGGADFRDPNKVFVPGEAIREAYQRPFSLKLSSDRQSLSGLTLSIGNLIGIHRFTKG